MVLAKLTRRIPEWIKTRPPGGPAYTHLKGLLHELMATGLPNYLFPETDLIGGFAPFSNLPNPYRITVDDQQKWFAE